MKIDVGLWPGINARDWINIDPYGIEIVQIYAGPQPATNVFFKVQKERVGHT